MVSHLFFISNRFQNSQTAKKSQLFTYDYFDFWQITKNVAILHLYVWNF